MGIVCSSHTRACFNHKLYTTCETMILTHTGRKHTTTLNYETVNTVTKIPGQQYFPITTILPRKYVTHRPQTLCFGWISYTLQAVDSAVFFLASSSRPLWSCTCLATPRESYQAIVRNLTSLPDFKARVLCKGNWFRAAGTVMSTTPWERTGVHYPDIHE